MLSRRTTHILQQIIIGCTFLLPTSLSYAQLDSIISTTTSTLEIGDKVLSSTLASIRYQFIANPQSFFNESGTPIVLSYEIPESNIAGLDSLSPIKSIRYGFIDSQTTAPCETTTPTNPNLLDGCLCQNHPGYLGVEVSFRDQYASGEVLPSSLAGIKVLFIAYNTTSNPIKIDQVNQKSSNYTGKFSGNNSDISLFTCFNPDGLGSIAGVKINAINTSSGALGSFNSCLSRAQGNENTNVSSSTDENEGT